MSGTHYRRGDEVHCQQLYWAEEMAQMLQEVGFQVEVERCYGQFVLPQAHAALIARKS